MLITVLLLYIEILIVVYGEEAVCYLLCYIPTYITLIIVWGEEGVFHLPCSSDIYIFTYCSVGRRESVSLTVFP